MVGEENEWADKEKGARLRERAISEERGRGRVEKQSRFSSLPVGCSTIAMWKTLVFITCQIGGTHGETAP